MKQPVQGTTASSSKNEGKGKIQPRGKVAVLGLRDYSL